LIYFRCVRKTKIAKIVSRWNFSLNKYFIVEIFHKQIIIQMWWISLATDLHYKDRTLSFSLKSRLAHVRNRTSDKGGQNERWRNARSAKYDRFSQEHAVLLQLCKKLYTYECIDTVLFCAAKVLIYENMPTERCNA
jgi:hypothetical protein